MPDDIFSAAAEIEELSTSATHSPGTTETILQVLLGVPTVYGVTMVLAFRDNDGRPVQQSHQCGHTGAYSLSSTAFAPPHFDLSLTLYSEQPWPPGFEAASMPPLSYISKLALEIERTQAVAPLQRLTNREKEILLWLAAGKSAWDIAQICNITEKTVASATKRMRDALDASSTPHLVAKALRSGVIMASDIH